MVIIFFFFLFTHFWLQRRMRFCTAVSVDFSFCPVIRCRSRTTCTASGSLPAERESNKVIVELTCNYITHTSTLLRLPFNCTKEVLFQFFNILAPKPEKVRSISIHSL